ncbi:hypothetical protein ON010_g11484 [Phytophthora cinnamomi]|nr:hypothetical protein ON010_g11484 [Phytophthora cinnamomi]
MATRRHSTDLPKVERQLTFSFACGGYLKMYMFGVAKALQEFELEKNAQLLGCSAGALAAAGLALHRDFDIIRDYVLANVIPKARSWPSGFFHGRDFLLDTLKAEGKLHEYEKLNDSQQLTVVYTSLSALKSRRVTQFDSEEHLADSLMASCCATPIAGLPFKLNGEWVMDGGIFDFQPIHGTKTVTISPFYCTSADIKPSLYVPMWWAVVPPGVRDVEWLFDLGYEDGLRWIVKNGFTGGRRNVEIPNKSTKYVGGWNTTVGRVLGYRSFESRVLDALFIGLFVCLRIGRNGHDLRSCSQAERHHGRRGRGIRDVESTTHDAVPLGLAGCKSLPEGPRTAGRRSTTGCGGSVGGLAAVSLLHAQHHEFVAVPSLHGGPFSGDQATRLLAGALTGVPHRDVLHCELVRVHALEAEGVGEARHMDRGRYESGRVWLVFGHRAVAVDRVAHLRVHVHLAQREVREAQQLELEAVHDHDHAQRLGLVLEGGDDCRVLPIAAAPRAQRLDPLVLHLRRGRAQHDARAPKLLDGALRVVDRAHGAQLDAEGVRSQAVLNRLHRYAVARERELPHPAPVLLVVVLQQASLELEVQRVLHGGERTYRQRPALGIISYISSDRVPPVARRRAGADSLRSRPWQSGLFC